MRQLCPGLCVPWHIPWMIIIIRRITKSKRISFYIFYLLFISTNDDEKKRTGMKMKKMSSTSFHQRRPYAIHYYYKMKNEKSAFIPSPFSVIRFFFLSICILFQEHRFVCLLFIFSFFLPSTYSTFQFSYTKHILFSDVT